MPKGPQGQKRPADAIGLAVLVGKIATGELKETLPASQAKGGKAGGKARAEKLAADKKSEIATKAAKARWGHRT